MNDDHLKFSDDIKQHWIIRKDECRDEFIALNGRRALGKKSGLDHICLISPTKAGLWITGRHSKIKGMQKQIPSLEIEQSGNGESVVSVPINDLHALCKAAGAKKRKRLTEEQRQRFRESCPFAKAKNKTAKPMPNASKIDKYKAKGI